jgi:hypothetical protein
MAYPQETEREPADDALLMIGVGKKKPGADMGGESMMGDEGEEPLPPGFDVAASEAFPDMDPAQYPALKRLIHLCMETY